MSSGFTMRGWNAENEGAQVSDQDRWGVEDLAASRKRKAYEFDEDVENEETEEEDYSRWHLVKRARRAVASSSIQGGSGWSLSMTAHKHHEQTAQGYAPSYFASETSALAPDSPTSVAEDFVPAPSNNSLPSFPSILRRRLTVGNSYNSSSSDSHILSPPSRSGLLSIENAVKEHSESPDKAKGEDDDDDERELGLMRWANDGSSDEYDGNRSIWWSMVYFVFLVMHWMTSRNSNKGKFL